MIDLPCLVLREQQQSSCYIASTLRRYLVQPSVRSTALSTSHSLNNNNNHLHNNTTPPSSTTTTPRQPARPTLPATRVSSSPSLSPRATRLTLNQVRLSKPSRRCFHRQLVQLDRSSSNRHAVLTCQSGLTSSCAHAIVPSRAHDSIPPPHGCMRYHMHAHPATLSSASP